MLPSAGLLDQVPTESRDYGRDLLVYLGVLGQDEDPFLGGARWAASGEVGYLFPFALPGGFIDELLDLEVFNMGTWQPVPAS